MILAGYIEWKIFKTSATKNRRVKREFPPQDDHWLVGKPTRFPVAKQNNYRIGDMCPKQLIQVWKIFGIFHPKQAVPFSIRLGFLFFCFVFFFLRILPRSITIKLPFGNIKAKQIHEKKTTLRIFIRQAGWIPVGCFQKIGLQGYPQIIH